MEKLLIIGCGIAGVMSYHNTSYLEPSIFEENECKTFHPHPAVFRIKKTDTANIIGCICKPVRVRKNIYYDGHLYDKCDIKMNNLYSLKTTGEINNKSIFYPASSCLRYQVEWNSLPAIPKIFFRHKLIKIEKFENRNVAIFDAGGILKRVVYEKMISTIPLPVIIAAANINTNLKFECKSICVVHIDVPEAKNVYQTIYFPEHNIPVYRATLESGKMIVEGVDEIGNDVLKFVLSIFGISSGNFEFKCVKKYQMKFGKMKSIDDDERKNLIYQLTDKFDIYSLGRYAIWKPITIDEVSDDLKTILKMMGSKYLMQKNR